MEKKVILRIPWLGDDSLDRRSMVVNGGAGLFVALVGTPLGQALHLDPTYVCLALSFVVCFVISRHWSETPLVRAGASSPGAAYLKARWGATFLLNALCIYVFAVGTANRADDVTGFVARIFLQVRHTSAEASAGAPVQQHVPSSFLVGLAHAQTPSSSALPEERAESATVLKQRRPIFLDWTDRDEALRQIGRHEVDSVLEVCREIAAVRSRLLRFPFTQPTYTVRVRMVAGGNFVTWHLPPDQFGESQVVRQNKADQFELVLQVWRPFVISATVQEGDSALSKADLRRIVVPENPVECRTGDE